LGRAERTTTREEEAPGAWVGSGAKSLVLSGDVDEPGLTRLLNAADPETGEQLRRPLASERWPGST
jgi:hypothetical protein